MYGAPLLCLAFQCMNRLTMLQATMSEEQYQSSSAAVSLKLSQPHVRDVWEERMPLALEAALSAGCVASVAPAVRGRPLSEGYDLLELQASLLLQGVVHTTVAAKLMC